MVDYYIKVFVFYRSMLLDSEIFRFYVNWFVVIILVEYYDSLVVNVNLYVFGLWIVNILSLNYFIIGFI